MLDYVLSDTAKKAWDNNSQQVCCLPLTVYVFMNCFQHCVLFVPCVGRVLLVTSRQKAFCACAQYAYCMIIRQPVAAYGKVTVMYALRETLSK